MIFNKLIDIRTPQSRQKAEDIVSPVIPEHICKFAAYTSEFRRATTRDLKRVQHELIDMYQDTMSERAKKRAALVKSGKYRGKL